MSNTYCIIRWVGEGVEWLVREGGQVEVVYAFHKHTGSSVVSSISNRNRHNPQDRL